MSNGLIPPILARFGAADWIVLAAYLALMLVIGLVAAYREKRQKSDTEDFFLGGRSMPTWALAISIVGTSLSAATFVGVPDEAYRGNLTYLILNLGGFIAAFVVGFLFVPRLYRAGTVTIYGFLGQRFGETAQIAVSCAFLVGRMLASGARLMLVAIPLCFIIFGIGQPEKWQMVVAICVVGFVGTFYTAFGGIKTVIWVDVIQFALVLGAAVLTVCFLLNRIPIGFDQIIDTLRNTRLPDGTDKLTLVDFSIDPAARYTLWTALIGSALFSTAAFGVDQDLAQRFLVAKSPARGAISVIASQFVGIAVVMLFVAIGMLLYIFYQRPDVMGASGPQGYSRPGMNQAAYQQFLLMEMPTFLSGLAIAGLFAVAQGSMDSAINAMASSAVADIYLPLKQRRCPAKADTHRPSDAPKITVAIIGAVMTLFAVGCALVYDPKKRGFLDFALSVMQFAFSGMLAVFLTALFTRRGNAGSVVAALLVGPLVVLSMQDFIVEPVSRYLLGYSVTIAYWWSLPVAVGVALIVCMCGSVETESRSFPRS